MLEDEESQQINMIEDDEGGDQEDTLNNQARAKSKDVLGSKHHLLNRLEQFFEGFMQNQTYEPTQNYFKMLIQNNRREQEELLALKEENDASIAFQERKNQEQAQFMEGLQERVFGLKREAKAQEGEVNNLTTI
mmetsp:Transcript_12226/g.18933  ORF Transcript_12226/g.18933 Transcript_12226/m.18933 type:complete len:134 (+) Transcript_12226:1292-1693(+)